MTDELVRRRSARPRRLQRRPFEDLLAEGVRWPFQGSFEFPDNPPAMPRMVSSRNPRGDLVFESAKMRRPVRCESSGERAFFSKLDAITEVLWFHEQAPKVRYEMHGKPRAYYPDAVVALRNGHVFAAEVKQSRDFALFETVCKINALAEWAHPRGFGVFLGNRSHAVGDFLHEDVPRGFRLAVLTAAKGSQGMSTDAWTAIRAWFKKGGRPSAWLQTLVLEERLVMTERPFNVRRAAPVEEQQMDAFSSLFETTAPVLPLAGSRRPDAGDGTSADS